MDRRPHDRSGLGRVVPRICLQDRDCRAVRRQKGSAPMTATWSTARGDRTAGPGIVPGSANAGDPPPAGGSPGVSSMGPSLSRCTKQLAVPRFRRLRRRSVSGVGRRGVARQDCASVGVEVDVVKDASTRLIQRSTPSPSAPATGATIGQPGKDMSAAHGGGTSPTTTPTASWATSPRPWSTCLGRDWMGLQHVTSGLSGLRTW